MCADTMSREELINLIDENVHCKFLKSMIFCGDEKNTDIFLTDARKISLYHNTLANVIFFYVYGHYRQFEQCGSNAYVNNFKRVVDTLDRLYKVDDLSYELIERVLMDIHVDNRLNRQISSKLGIRDIETSNSFPNHMYLAREFRKTNRMEGDMDIEKRLHHFSDMMSTLEFLRRTEVILKKIDNVKIQILDEKYDYDDLYEVEFRYKNPLDYNSNKEIPLNMMVICANDCYYFLEHFEEQCDKNGVISKLNLNYVSMSRFESSLSICVKNNETIDSEKVPTIFSSSLDEIMNKIVPNATSAFENDIIRDLHSVNYKYLRNLSLAIVDTLDDDDKREMYSRYSIRYRSLFSPIDGNAGNKPNNYNWDGIISMLLVEEGAVKVIQLLLYKNRRVFEKLSSNLEARFGSERMSADNIRKSASEKCKFLKGWENVYMPQGDTFEAHRELDDALSCARSEIAALCMVNALSKVPGDLEKIETGYSFPIGMNRRIKFLEVLIISTTSVVAKIEIVKRVVKQTLKELICFYEGILSYAIVKNDFEEESRYRCLSKEEIFYYQSIANASFEKTVRSSTCQINDCKYEDINVLLDYIRQLCNRCSVDECKLFKKTLGRDKLLDVTEMEGVGACLEGVKNEDQAKEAISFVISVLFYLSTGHPHENGTSKVPRSESIFPYIATYEYGNKTRDGYDIKSFSVYIYGGFREVKILSEFNYEINSKYYCLPNLLRSTDDLWIEPVLVKIFDVEDRESEIK